MTTRHNLRKFLKGQRADLPKNLHTKFSLSACQTLLDSSLWANAQNIGLYTSIGSEVDTSLLLQTIFEIPSPGTQPLDYARESSAINSIPSTQVYGPKHLLLPVCKKGSAHMKLVRCFSLDELVLGEFGILSPSWDVPEVVPDLLVMPLVGYDKHGGRLGYGGGYYDRLCARPEFGEVFRLGLAFSCQGVESVHAQPWDMPLHAVCTEHGLHFFI